MGVHLRWLYPAAPRQGLTLTPPMWESGLPFQPCRGVLADSSHPALSVAPGAPALGLLEPSAPGQAEAATRDVFPLVRRPEACDQGVHWAGSFRRLFHCLPPSSHAAAFCLHPSVPFLQGPGAQPYSSVTSSDLITSATTLFPKKVTFRGPGGYNFKEFGETQLIP